RRGERHAGSRKASRSCSGRARLPPPVRHRPQSAALLVRSCRGASPLVPPSPDETAAPLRYPALASLRSPRGREPIPTVYRSRRSLFLLGIEIKNGRFLLGVKMGKRGEGAF